MIRRWDILTIGNLSRNRYWGEGEDRARRSAICTSTLITGEGYCLLVDPTLAEETAMVAELDRRTGLAPAAVTAVFLTHAHGDHHAGMRHFPGADWVASPDVADALSRPDRYPGRVRPVLGRLFDDIEVVFTPGHTLNHHSLRFEYDGRVVLVAGDAAMTHDFWSDRRGYFNSEDPALASRTIASLASGGFDIIVPGHDNYFLTR